MGFVPLHIISSYSLLQSTLSIDRLVAQAQQMGYSALALTDVDVMYGTVAFYDACTKAGIKPIIGLTLNVTGLVRTDQSAPLILLARDQAGYHDLMRISTAKRTLSDGATLALADVAQWLDHLFVITPADGELVTLLELQDEAGAEQYWERLSALAKAIKVGVTPTLAANVIDALRAFSKRHSAALVGVDSIRYFAAEDAFAKRVLAMIESSEQIAAPVAAKNRLGKDWFKPAAMFEADYAKHGLAQAAEETERVAAQCHVEIKKHPTQLPQYPTPNGVDSQAYLRKLCQSGLTARLVQNQVPDAEQKQYQARLENELAIIDRMGFDDYFLIVWDVINYAHSAGITTGPGRGSAAGSLVAYVLSITDVDPIQYDLLFERFLNEERAQMPDIDLDIPDDRRDDVLNYVHQKYGHDRVAQIITFDTLSAKAVLRDVNRVFGISSADASRWSQAIPNELHIQLKQAYQQSPGLRQLVQTDSLHQLIYETALKLEGLPRHYSTHAAGVILSAEPLVELAPLQNGKESLLMVQYAKNAAEEIGLLKIDFLGLRNLSFLAAIVKEVRAHFDADFDIRRIDLNDPATLRLFQTGKTSGVFQFESAGIRNTLRDVNPTDFNLVSIVDALYRPGPADNIKEFVARKDGRTRVSYPADALKPILAPTYGIIVYQEQVMQVASVMGGFTLGQADILRRAMSKKKQAVMDAMRTQFIAGAQQRGFSKTVAEQTFDYIDRFAAYGFNKSHAVAYSKMAFQLAYLKAHYQTAFFTALFNSEIGSPKMRVDILEARQANIQLQAPNVNVSGRGFELIDDQIMFGLGAIRGLRTDLVTAILAEREQHGPFQDLANLLKRLDPKFRKAALLTPLIDAGALDCFGRHRSELLAALPELVESIQLSGGSLTLFETLQPKLRAQDEMPLGELLEREHQVLGVYLSKYPTDQFKLVGQAYHTVSIAQLGPSVGQRVNVLIYVNHVKTIRTKSKGQQMAFVTASDPTGQIDIVVFPNQYQQNSAMLKPNRVLLVGAKVEQREGQGLQLVANQVAAAANVQGQLQKRQPAGTCYLRLQADVDSSKLQALAQIIQSHRGAYQVLLFWPAQNRKQLLDASNAVNADAETKQRLAQLLGPQNVIYKKR